MSEVLDLPSELCQFSALHGLGHWHAHHPEQVEQIVDAFVTEQRPQPHLIEYASRARLGSVLWQSRGTHYSVPVSTEHLVGAASIWNAQDLTANPAEWMPWNYSENLARAAV